jgi:hypothetical protein
MRLLAVSEVVSELNVFTEKKDKEKDKELNKKDNHRRTNKRGYIMNFDPCEKKEAG